LGALEGGNIVKPKIDGTRFGSITISGEVVEHDVLIRQDGKVKKRKKELSKAKYGTSHTVSVEEAKHIYEEGAERLIVGTGHNGMLELSEGAAKYFREKECSVEMLPTPRAVKAWNAAHGHVIGMFHVTC
jgi:hypothetical protein